MIKKMKFTKPRATLAEVLAFCNAVRDAGGGNALDALMPAVPEDASKCLIAKNLNFNCHVLTTDFRGEERWVMVTDFEVRDRIAQKMGLAKVNMPDWEDWDDNLGDDNTGYAVVLPKEIGQVAHDFDMWTDAAHCCDRHILDDGQEVVLKEFTPYVEESVREAYKLGGINEKGELIL